MTLIVEDGSNVPNAEAYADVTYADAYFAARGNTAWAALDTPKKEINLRNGADYMTATLRDMWAGERVNMRNGLYARQSMDWPRQGVYIDRYTYIQTDEIPDEIKRANCELAMKAEAGELLQDTTGVWITREKVGPIETEYGSYGSSLTFYNYVNQLLAPFMRQGGAGGGRLVRV